MDGAASLAHPLRRGVNIVVAFQHAARRLGCRRARAYFPSRTGVFENEEGAGLLGCLQHTEVAVCAQAARHGEPVDRRAIADANENTSMLITTNLAFADWPQVFGDAKMTTAMPHPRPSHTQIFVRSRWFSNAQARVGRPFPYQWCRAGFCSNRRFQAIPNKPLKVLAKKLVEIAWLRVGVDAAGQRTIRISKTVEKTLELARIGRAFP